jgi:NAD(P)-dependent dehydrogenase (short-subunit alcohol dehydrogenase family)
MNIVVIGAGRGFGKDFVKLAKAQGHTVKTLSHKKSAVTDAVINFLFVSDAVKKFNYITEDLPTIDILLYNSTYKGYPNKSLDFTSQGTLSERSYQYGLNVNVVAPHLLSIESLKKMQAGSKIFFMTTDVIYDRDRVNDRDHLSYYGGKAYQHQLMLALAEHNDKGVIVSSISPYFDYNKTFDIVYNHIFGNTENGKVFDCWE